MTSDPYPPSDETASLVLLRSFKRKIKEGRGRVSDPFFRHVPKPTDAQLQGSPVAMQMRENAKK